MLERVVALPNSQGQLPLDDRNRQFHAGPCGYVRACRRAFVDVPISAGVLRRQAIEKRLEISANVLRGVLLDEQSGRGMPAK
jgi:hypothetical protein